MLRKAISTRRSRARRAAPAERRSSMTCTGTEATNRTASERSTSARDRRFAVAGTRRGHRRHTRGRSRRGTSRIAPCRAASAHARDEFDSSGSPNASSRAAVGKNEAPLDTRGDLKRSWSSGTARPRLLRISSAKVPTRPSRIIGRGAPIHRAASDRGGEHDNKDPSHHRPTPRSRRTRACDPGVPPPSARLAHRPRSSARRPRTGLRVETLTLTRDRARPTTQRVTPTPSNTSSPSEALPARVPLAPSSRTWRRTSLRGQRSPRWRGSVTRGRASPA